MDELVSSDVYPSLCDHRYCTATQTAPDMCFRGGEVVFCKTDEVSRFFERLRLGRRRIVLVTGQSDFPCDDKRQKFVPPQVARWFSPNVTHAHPRVCALPLGIGPAGDIGTASGAALTAAFRPRAIRQKWLYVNFRPETNIAVRKPIADHFCSLASRAWVTFREPEPKGENALYLSEMGEHRFVLCPPGNGVDTHRAWEALATGAVPVVQKAEAMEPFSHLPILFVDDLRSVDLPLLEQSWRKFAADSAVPEECFASHWQSVFDRAGSSLSRNPLLSWCDFSRESLLYGAGVLRRRLLQKTS